MISGFWAVSGGRWRGTKRDCEAESRFWVVVLLLLLMVGGSGSGVDDGVGGEVMVGCEGRWRVMVIGG